MATLPLKLAIEEGKSDVAAYLRSVGVPIFAPE
jgi:hypothetical protein